MGLESATYINDLVATNPTGSDLKSVGDDQIRLNKSTSKNTFPGFTGAVMVGGVFSGTAAAHVLTPATALPSYTAQTFFTYTPTAVNTGACTVNVSGLGAKSIKTVDGADPTAGDIPANKSLLIQYDGTNMILMAGGSYVAKTGNSTITGNITLVGNLVQTGDHSVSGTLSGPSMTAKGNVAGQIWAGNQDFTAATITSVTQATGDNTTKVATTAFVANQVLTATLPGQAGNSGKFLTTDGTTASWGGNGGATETTSAVDITLTASSQQAQAVNMTVSGKSVTLPDATTMTVSGESFILIATGYPYSVRNSAGTLLTTVASGQTVTMALLNNAVAAGTWAAAASVTAGGSVYTGTYSLAQAVAITGSGDVTMLSADTGILVVGESANLAAYVLTVNGNSVTFGIVNYINAIGTISKIKLVPISATKAIVGYAQGGPNAEFICLTAGTATNPASRTITAGAALTTAKYLNHEFGGIGVTPTQALFAHFDNGDWVAYVINEAGGVLTKGADRILAAGGFGLASNITKLSASKFLITSTNNELVAVVADVSGSTVTSGTKYQLAATGYGGYKSVAIGVSDTKAHIIASNITNVVTDIWAINIASQTISSPVKTTFGTDTTYSCYLAKLSEQKYLLLQDYIVSSKSRATVISVGATVTAGNPQDVPLLTTYTLTFGTSGVSSNKAILANRGVSNYAEATILEIGAAI